MEPIPWWLSIMCSVFLTPYMLLFWLCIHRRSMRDTGRGRVFRIGRYRIGGYGYSAAWIRWMAVFVGFLMLVLLILVARTGYHWWFGTAATQGLWLTPMYLSDAKIIHQRYHRSMTLFALASLPFSIGLLIGWLDFADLATLPVIVFYALTSLSVLGYAYVAARPISTEVE